jgi:hypothetical protein
VTRSSPFASRLCSNYGRSILDGDPADVRTRAWHQVRAAIFDLRDLAGDRPEVARRPVDNNGANFKLVAGRKGYASLCSGLPRTGLNGRVNRLLASPPSIECSDRNPSPVAVAFADTSQQTARGAPWIPGGPSDFRQFLSHMLDFFFSHPLPLVFSSSFTHLPSRHKSYTLRN